MNSFHGSGDNESRSLTGSVSGVTTEDGRGQKLVFNECPRQLARAALRLVADL